jgi:hypothetical protein
MDLIDEIERTGDETLQTAFIENVYDARGVSKRTYVNRFPDFDRLLVNQLNRCCRERPFRLLDVAISDGSTSLDLFRKIDAVMGPEIQYTATDRDGRYLLLREREKQGKRVIVSPCGDIVQVVWPPFVFASRPDEHLLLFPINRWVRPTAMRFAYDVVSKWKCLDQSIEAKEFFFASRAFRQALSLDPRLRFAVWDIATPWTGEQAHCVRAMNILNPQYFSPRLQRSIVVNLMANLFDGGILAVGSNDEPGSDLDGAIYLLHGDRLMELISINKGFRCREAIEDLIVPPEPKTSAVGK